MKKVYIATFDIVYFERDEVEQYDGATIEKDYYSSDPYDFFMEKLNRNEAVGMNISTLSEFTTDLNDELNTDLIWTIHFFIEE